MTSIAWTLTDKKRELQIGGNMYSTSSKIKLVILGFLPYLSLVFRTKKSNYVKWEMVFKYL